MLDEMTPLDAARRLRSALTDRALQATHRAFAEALADRLENGVRVVLLGPQGVGKSALCDAMVGLPGAPPPAGLTRHFFMEGSPARAPDLPGPVQSFALDCRTLGHVQLLDLSALDTVPIADLASLALDYADIVLWCTEHFGAEEAALWARASDELKDRSFLVLTRADALARQGALSARIEALQDIVAEEFHSLLPTTAFQVLHARSKGETVSDTQFAASGIKALVEAVQGLVLSGQRADLDNALLFLERQGLSADNDPVPQPHAAEAVQHAAQEAPRAAAEVRQVAADVPRAAEQTPHSVEDALGAVENAAFRASPDFVAQATDALMTRACDLAELGYDKSEGDMSEVLELCGTISEALVDVVQAQVQSHPDVSPWYHAFQDASDKIMLMALENDMRSAADAVTILLQLRRDVQSWQVS